MIDTKPVFIVVGAMKSGTTTLQHYLIKHPHISFVPNEVHFFDQEENYKKGINWYLSGLQKNVNDKTIIIGEKTPTYSYLEHIPERIFNYFPQSKIVWVFRNPVDRAYSNYWHAVGKGSEWLSFEKAVQKENERIKQNQFWGYLKRGLYSEQIKRYLNFFNASQMHYIIFEDLIRNPDAELKALCHFLGVPEYDHSDKNIQKNITIYPKWPWSLYYARKWFGNNSKIYKKIFRINKKYGKKPKISSQLRMKLLNYYQAPNAELSGLINKDLSSWKL